MSFDIAFKYNQKRDQQLLSLLLDSLIMQYRKCKSFIHCSKSCLCPIFEQMLTDFSVIIFLKSLKILKTLPIGK